MASFVREGNELKVSGTLGPGENEELFRLGSELLEAEAPQLLLDISRAEHEGSSLVGAVARLGAEARVRSKSLTVRAEGRIADLLVWAGLHRIVTLHVSEAAPLPE